MAVVKIYTKTGDQGQTALGSGERVAKDHLRIQCYGTVDELNSWLGLCATTLVGARKTLVERIQQQLFSLGAMVANPKLKNHSRNGKVSLDAIEIQSLESAIDTHQAKLKPLKTFIMPGGSLSAAYLHVARTICRRAERELITVSHNSPIPENSVIYLNRLSDLLFVLARAQNASKKVKDVPW